MLLEKLKLAEEELNSTEGHPMVKLLQEVPEKYPNYETSFMGVLMKSQLQRLASGKCKAKWNPIIVQRCQTLQYRSSYRLIDTLRGKAFQGQGSRNKLNLDPENWGIILPSESTLKRYLPPINPYQRLSKSRRRILSDLVSKGVNHGGLVFDNFELKQGLVFHSPSGVIIGFNEAFVASSVKTDDKKRRKSSFPSLLRKLCKYFMSPATAKLHYRFVTSR